MKLFVNLPHCPGFSEVEDMTPVMDVNLASPPKGVVRTLDGRRDVEEWGLKVQKMASVHSVTLVFVRHRSHTNVTTTTTTTTTTSTSPFETDS